MRARQVSMMITGTETETAAYRQDEISKRFARRGDCRIHRLAMMKRVTRRKNCITTGRHMRSWRSGKEAFKAFWSAFVLVIDELSSLVSFDGTICLFFVFLANNLPELFIHTDSPSKPSCQIFDQNLMFCKFTSPISFH